MTIYDDLSLLGKSLFDQDKVIYLLHGLDLDYNPFFTTMVCPPLPTYHSLILQLSNYDTALMTYRSPLLLPSMLIVSLNIQPDVL